MELYRIIKALLGALIICLYTTFAIYIHGSGMIPRLPWWVSVIGLMYLAWMYCVHLVASKSEVDELHKLRNKALKERDEARYQMICVARESLRQGVLEKGENGNLTYTRK